MPQGHPKLAATAAGDLYAVWDESLGTPASPAVKAGHGNEHGHDHALTGEGRAVMVAARPMTAPDSARRCQFRHGRVRFSSTRPLRSALMERS